MKRRREREPRGKAEARRPKARERPTDRSHLFDHITSLGLASRSGVFPFFIRGC